MVFMRQLSYTTPYMGDNTGLRADHQYGYQLCKQNRAESPIDALPNTVQLPLCIEKEIYTIYVLANLHVRYGEIVMHHTTICILFLCLQHYLQVTLINFIPPFVISIYCMQNIYWPWGIRMLLYYIRMLYCIRLLLVQVYLSG